MSDSRRMRRELREAMEGMVIDHLDLESVERAGGGGANEITLELRAFYGAKPNATVTFKVGYQGSQQDGNFVLEATVETHGREP